MEIRPELHLKQTQKLIMTPQLQQAIKMLQLSNMELGERIEEELMENPALEVDEQEREFERDTAKEVDYNKIAADGENKSYESGLEDEYFFEDRSYTRLDRRDGEDKKREFIEGAISREETLKEYVLWQLRLLKISDEDFELTETLVSYLDSNGYFPKSTDEISSELRVPLQRVEKAIGIIQALDPPGVGARDLQECLLIQVERAGTNQLAAEIIKNHLNDLRLKKYDEISKKLKVPLSRVKEAISFIAKLEPYPGRQFYTEETKYIIPEVIIQERDGEFEVVPNNYSLPKLRVNNYFQRLSMRRKGDKRIKEFASEKVQRAKNFIHSIEQRESTLMRVAKTILEEQRDFFEKGPKYLKPLTLRDISARLDLHESTISRITSSKYMQTPFGIFSLKYFFSNPIPTQGSKEYAATSIKEMIKDIIQNEGSKKHLSDQKIADLLAKKGIKIARRTIAKYRKGLNILPSNMRR